MLDFTDAGASDPLALGAGFAGLSVAWLQEDGRERLGAELEWGLDRNRYAAALSRARLPLDPGGMGWRPARLPLPGDLLWWAGLDAEVGEFATPLRSWDTEARGWAALSIPDVLAPGFAAQVAWQARLPDRAAALAISASARVADRTYRDPDGTTPSDITRQSAELDARIGSIHAGLRLRGTRRHPVAPPSAIERGSAVLGTILGMPLYPEDYIPDRWRFVASIHRSGPGSMIVAPRDPDAPYEPHDPDAPDNPEGSEGSGAAGDLEYGFESVDSGLAAYLAFGSGLQPEMDLAADLALELSPGAAGGPTIAASLLWKGLSIAPEGFGAVADPRPRAAIQFRRKDPAGMGSISVRIGAIPSGKWDPAGWPGAHAVTLRVETRIVAGDYRIHLSVRSPEGGWNFPARGNPDPPRIGAAVSYLPGAPAPLSSMR